MDQKAARRTSAQASTSTTTTTSSQERQPIIVFCDTQNQVIDEKYAARLCDAFRQQTGWKVMAGTPICNQLRDFSKGYSKINRDPGEVAIIFRTAIGQTMTKEDRDGFGDVFNPLKFN